MRNRFGERATDGVEVANVGADPVHAMAVTGESFNGAVDILATAADHRHVGALSGERVGDSEVDPGGASEDDGVPPKKIDIDVHGSVLAIATNVDLSVTHTCFNPCFP